MDSNQHDTVSMNSYVELLKPCTKYTTVQFPYSVNKQKKKGGLFETDFASLSLTVNCF